MDSRLHYYYEKYEILFLIFLFLYSTIQIFKLIPYQLDDAYITYQYAKNYISSGVFSFNLGQNNTEGFTSFFWFICSAAFGLINIKNIHYAGPILGYISYILTFILIIKTSSSKLDKLLKASLIAFMPTLLFYSITGLETAFFSLLIATICLGLCKKIPIHLTLIACAITPWVRPETPWISLSFLLVFLASEDKKTEFKRLFPFAITLLTSQILLILCRLYIFNDILPNTYYEKESDHIAGAMYIYQALTTPWVFLLLIISFIYNIASNNKLLFFIACSWLITPIISGNDWMQHYRFLLPAFIIFIASIETKKTLKKKQIRFKYFIILSLTISYVFYASTTLSTSTKSAKNFQSMMSQEDNWLQHWFQKNNIKTIAAIDIGKLAYSNDFLIFDLGGLTDKKIASLPGKHMHKEIPLDYFFKINPDAIIIRLDKIQSSPQLNTENIMSPVEANLISNSAIAEKYTPAFIVAPNYKRNPYYGQLILIRKDLTDIIRKNEELPIQYINGVPFILFKEQKGLFIE